MIRTIYIITNEDKIILSAFTTLEAAKNEIEVNYSEFPENFNIEPCALNIDARFINEIKKIVWNYWCNWKLTIKYFFTVFYKGGDYYFFGTGGLGLLIGVEIAFSTLSVIGVFTCPFGIWSLSFHRIKYFFEILLLYFQTFHKDI